MITRDRSPWAPTVGWPVQNARLPRVNRRAVRLDNITICDILTSLQIPEYELMKQSWSLWRLIAVLSCALLASLAVMGTSSAGTTAVIAVDTNVGADGIQASTTYAASTPEIP